MSKLEDMMKADGWVIGYDENWGVKYWSFRKEGFDIGMRHVDTIEDDESDFKNYKKWRKENE